jgi:murein L,D-transpeptidase YafK
MAPLPSVRGATGTAPAREPVRIVILKSQRTLTLLRGSVVVKTYKVALGTNPVGAKTQQGDYKTPEGEYIVDFKVPNSMFYKALHISYPNAADRARAHALGVNPGGAVEIHGLGKKYGWVGAAHRLHDWTFGCIALTNEEIDELYAAVPVGTRVTIEP